MRLEVLQRQPVMPGGFQANQRLAVQRLERLHQTGQPGLGVFHLEYRFVRLAAFVQDRHRVFTLGDIDATGIQHCSTTGCATAVKRGDLRRP